MKELERILLEEYYGDRNKLDDLEVGTEEYKTVLEDKQKTVSDLVKVKQIESENNREKYRNWIAVGTTLFVGFHEWRKLVKVLKFDEVSTVTSTMGRSIINNGGLLSKIFKR